MPSHLPDAHLFRSGSGEPVLRWGVVGPGWIASEFTTALRQHTAQQIVAVASRSLARAETFAATHGIETALGSVDALVSRHDVDVVYVATPQSEHLAVGLAAIAAGKHVLIEKPLALDAIEAQQLVDAGRAAGVLVMEGMWSRYLPQTSVIRQLLADGVLGDIQAVSADHGQRIAADPTHRLYRPELGGGALLDLGIYPLQFDSMVLGEPTRVTARGSRTTTGVDAQSTLILEHGDTVLSTVTTTLLAKTPTMAAISGTEATITVDPAFYIPTSFTLAAPEYGGTTLRWVDDTGLDLFSGLSWEATALAQFVGEGRLESPLHTLNETVSILRTIDEAKSQLTSGPCAAVPEGAHL